MITTTQIAPRPSWTNPNPTSWDTGFKYVATSPAMAIGPQFRGAAERSGGTSLVLAGLLAAAAGGLYYALRPARGRARRR